MATAKAKTRTAVRKPVISLILPVYNEEENLPVQYDRIIEALSKMKKKRSYEIIFVDDGSTDGSRPILKELAKKG